MSGKIVIELDYMEWLSLLSVLTEVSRYKGTGTGHRAGSLLEKLRERAKQYNNVGVMV